MAAYSDTIEYDELQVTLERKKGPYGTAHLRFSEGTEWSSDVTLDLDPITVGRLLSSEYGPRQRMVKQSSLYEVQDPAQRLGDLLFAALFDGRSEAFYRAALASAEQRSRGLRLRLDIKDQEWASLPWEFLFDGQEFISLSTRTPLLRNPVAMDPVSKPVNPPTDKLRMLIVSAKSISTPPLDDTIDDLTRSLEPFPQFETTLIVDATADAFMSGVLDHDFEVLHLIGSGREDRQGNQALELLDESGDPVLWADSQLGPLLALKPDVRFVFLCACFSDRLAATLSRINPATLGIRRLITLDGARGMTRGLYRAIARGQPIEAAVNMGRQEIDRQNPGSLEWGLPVLYMRPGNVPLLARPSREAETPETWFGIAPAPPFIAPADSAQSRQVRQVQFRLRIVQQNLAALRAYRESYMDAVPQYLQKVIQETKNQAADIQAELETLNKQDGGGD